MSKNISADKSLEFAVRIVNLYKFLTTEHKEFVLSKQLLRCGTSIGANIAEAEHAQSRLDFLSKINIALKEANETRYWLILLHKTNYLDSAQYESIEKDIEELISILVAICKKIKAE
ncbi:MAG: four helix bundle protein [Clostridia bacterium]|nr:four helix bundle protein [Clostridia bacterium]